MKICVLQHAAYEGPGEIAVWATKRGHSVFMRHLYGGESLPDFRDFDLLAVMGGEMNIYQDRDWPWLKQERGFIHAALNRGKPAIGICLGAQLIADALGARVTQNAEYELGWLPITWTEEARAAFPEIPPVSTALHWHGDTFALPQNALRLAASEACPEQGFLIPNKCLGLQFHLEVDVPLVKQFVESQGDWPAGRYVQSPAVILDSAASHCAETTQLLYGTLDQFCGV